MSTTNRISPISQLASAEQALVAGLHAAADRLDQIGTSAVDAALARLQASADAAKLRLAEAYSRAQSIAGSVLDEITDLADMLGTQLADDLAQQSVPLGAEEVTLALPAEPCSNGHAEDEVIDLSQPATNPNARQPGEPFTMTQPAGSFERMAERVNGVTHGAAHDAPEVSEPSEPAAAPKSKRRGRKT